MKSILFLIFGGCTAVWSQTAAPQAPPPKLPDLPDDAVVAVFDDGVKFTMADFRHLYTVLPPQNQQMAAHDLKNFVEQYALMRKLAKMGEADKLDQQSPSKDALEYYRFFILSQAELNGELNKIVVPETDVTSYYDKHKDEYKQVKVKAIYISFSKAAASQVKDGKKVLTQDEARAKAQALAAQLHSGADFVKLVRENSDDATSKEKDGDFATLRPNDNIPDAIRKAVFALKQGEVTDAIEQPNGFYLLRADEVSYRPLPQVRDDIYNTIKQERFKQWLDATHDAAKVQFPTPAFLSGSAAK